MYGWVLEWFRLLSPYAKIFEYAFTIIVIVAAIHFNRQFKKNAVEIKSMQGAAIALREQTSSTAATLRAVSMEAASTIEAAANNALQIIRATQNEQRSVELENFDASGPKGEATTVLEERARVAAVEEAAVAVSTGVSVGTLAGTALFPAGLAAIAAAKIAKQQLDKNADAKAAHKAWWKPVVSAVYADNTIPPAKLYWKNNVRVPMPWSNTWITAWRNDAEDGVCGVALSGSAEQIDAFWRAVRNSKESLLKELPNGSTIEPGRFGIGLMRPVGEFRSDDERRAWLIKNIEAFATVIAAKMRALTERPSVIENA